VVRLFGFGTSLVWGLPFVGCRLIMPIACDSIEIVKTVKQAAKLLKLSEMRVRQLLQQGRIASAEKMGRDWVLPDKPVIAPPKNPRGGRAKK
jgi:excisionase family DNA binding protein